MTKCCYTSCKYTCFTVGVDYTASNFQVTFTPVNQGQLLCRTIPVMDDLVCEGDETISVSVTTIDPAVTLSPSSAVVTIIDNDGKFVQQFRGVDNF